MLWEEESAHSSGCLPASCSSSNQNVQKSWLTPPTQTQSSAKRASSRYRLKGAEDFSYSFAFFIGAETVNGPNYFGFNSTNEFQETPKSVAANRLHKTGWSVACCGNMLESFSALLFAVSAFQQGAGSIPEVLFSLYTMDSRSFSQRASLIPPRHSEGDLSDWNMLPARPTQTATSLSRRRHFVVVWASVLPAGKWNAQQKKQLVLHRAPNGSDTASDVSPEFYCTFPLCVPYKFSNFLSNNFGGNDKSDFHNHSLGSQCFQWSDKGEIKKALFVLLLRNSNSSNSVC